MLTDDVAKWNYKKIESIYGKEVTKLWFSNWTYFKDNDISVRQAIDAIEETKNIDYHYHNI